MRQEFSIFITVHIKFSHSRLYRFYVLHGSQVKNSKFLGILVMVSEYKTFSQL